VSTLYVCGGQASAANGRCERCGAPCDSSARCSALLRRSTTTAYDPRPSPARAELEAVRIVERYMTQHWDLAACPCWICKAGRTAGLAPREEYLAAPGAPAERGGLTDG
jgi:hypothetical protein